MTTPPRIRSVVSGLTLAAGLLSVPPAATPAGAAAPAAQAATTCVAAKPGQTRLALSFAGRSYSALTYLPRGYRRSARLPLVLNLHGSTHDGANQQRLTGIEPVADRGGFLVVAPNGGVRSGSGYAWNVPGVPLADGRPVPPGARDDVAFLAAVIRAAQRTFCADPRRVYVTGHSGGGRMASAFGCARADLVAAIAPVSGLRAGPADRDDPSRPAAGGCRPSRPVSVLSVHGGTDRLNPYQGGGDARWGYSVPTALTTWQRLDGCLAMPLAFRVSEHASMQRTVSCRQQAEVISYLLDGAGHVWPGSPLPPVPGEDPAIVNELDATGIIWSFLRRHQIG